MKLLVIYDLHYFNARTKDHDIFIYLFYQQELVKI